MATGQSRSASFLLNYLRASSRGGRCHDSRENSGWPESGSKTMKVAIRRPSIVICETVNEETEKSWKKKGKRELTSTRANYVYRMDLLLVTFCVTFWSSSTDKGFVCVLVYDLVGTIESVTAKASGKIGNFCNRCRRDICILNINGAIH